MWSSARVLCRFAPVLGLLVFATACGRSGPAATAPPAAEAVVAARPADSPFVAEAPPTLRLPSDVAPRAVSLELTLDPAATRFTGRTTIEVALSAPRRIVWLNAADLTIAKATVTVGGRAIVARPLPQPRDFVGLELPETLPAGPATLTIDYEGPLPSDTNDGVYRVEELGVWGIYTQFEAIDARRAFPGFDEPAFKVPYTVALRVPRGMMAVANTAQVGDTPLADGWRRVQFAPTRPLPSYLIAFAVGAFEAVDLGPVGSAGIPARVIVPKGRTGDVGYVRETLPRLVELCEAWFGTPHPYPKLDLIAVPRKGGAMENPGLITFGLPILAIPTGELTITRKRRFVTVAIHELAHQWFGDLVTAAWWDDLWLNEAFATWIEKKITPQAEPTWGTAVDAVGGAARVMDADSFATARRIREPIVTRDDIEDAFDGITYTKGRSVLAMVEAWIGPEAFQRGVRRYLAAHADGNATTADFLTALSAEAGRDVAPVFASFIDQTGVPLVETTLVCDAGSSPTLQLRQRRYRPAGAGGPDDGARWRLPLCVRYDRGDAAPGRACTLLEEPTGALVLDDATTCPRWVVPNAEMAGYARVKLAADLFTRTLAAPTTTMAERVGLVLDLGALARAGVVPLAEALAPLPALVQGGFAPSPGGAVRASPREPARQLTSASLALAGLVDDEHVPDALRPARAAWLRGLFGARARKLGLVDREGESDEDRLLRPAVVGMVADDGEDPVLAADARKRARAWLTNPSSLPAGRVAAVLALAASHGDRPLFDALLARAKAEPDRSKRGAILAAVGSFRDPRIVAAALAEVLAGDPTATARPGVVSDSLVPRESIGLLWGALGDRATRELGWVFLEQHLDQLVARLPRDYGAHLIDAGSAFCDPVHRARAVSLFEARVAGWTGGPRAYAQMLEEVDLCIAQKAVRQPAIEAFLRARPTGR